jgi:hypothetical protein
MNFVVKTLNLNIIKKIVDDIGAIEVALQTSNL